MTDLAARAPELFAGRYRLTGSSERGRARRATDTTLHRDVMVAVAHYPAGGTAEFERDLAAARRTSRLVHHGLVPLLGIETGRDAGDTTLALITGLADGPTLAELLSERGTLTARQVAHLGFDIAETLEYVHRHGVAVGTIDPDHVVLTDGPGGRSQGRLLDLRDAVDLDSAPHAAADDVRAVAVLLRTALVGLHAPEGSDLPSAVPESLSGTLRAMLRADPAARPNATDLAVEFRACIAAEFGRHRRLKAAIADRPDDEEEKRLAALHRYDLLDTPPEGAFDRITGLAARSMHTPISTVSIVDRDRIWFKSHHGLDAEQIGRDPGLCATVVTTGASVYIPDARSDESAMHNPLIAGDLSLQFYAGVPLTSADGYVLGALSIADYEPRELSAEQLDTLDRLGTLVTHELEMRLATRRAVLQHE